MLTDRKNSLIKRVLIIGISGFIGKNLAKRLNSEGYEVYGVSRSGNVITGAKEVYKGDMLDYDSMLRVCKNKDVVIFLAGITEHEPLVNKPIESMKKNIDGAFNVLQACSKAEVSHFIYPSSGKVYGPTNSLPFSEKKQPKPITFLGKYKLVVEDLIKYFSHYSDKLFSILRIFNVYGGGQRDSFLVPTIINQAKEGTKQNKTIILGDTEVKKDYLFIDDVVSAFIAVIKNPPNPADTDKNSEGTTILNVGSGISLSPADIVESIGTLLGKTITIEHNERKMRPIERYEERANVTKLEALGWSQKFSLEKGLKKTIETIRRSHQ